MAKRKKISMKVEHVKKGRKKGHKKGHSKKTHVKK